MRKMLEKIDQKDKKILALLDFNARMPLSEIGRKVGLTKQTTDYRIKSLMKKGIIEGFFPIINTPMLGYTYCRIFVQFGNLDQKTEQDFRKYVFEHKNLFWAFALGGEYDYLLVYWVENLTYFEKINKEFKARFENAIRKKSEQVITNVIHLPHKIFSQKEIQRFDLKETNERIKLDPLDKEILRQLCIDARMPLTEISKKTKTNPKVANYRIKRMQKENFIAGFRPIISYEKLGLTYYKVFFNLSTRNEKELQKFEQFILSNLKTLFLVKGIGIEGDLDVELLAESNHEFFDFISETKKNFPNTISDYKYLIYTKTIKVNYLPFI